MRESFRQQLTRENMSGIISKYSTYENNTFVKAIPLQIKIPFLRLTGIMADRKDTAAFSNIGRITMPAEVAGYIRLFDVFLSTKRPQLCLCSFGDTLAVSVSSPLKDTSLQRSFFRNLAKLGLSIQVVSNLDQLNGEEKMNNATV